MRTIDPAALVRALARAVEAGTLTRDALRNERADLVLDAAGVDAEDVSEDDYDAACAAILGDAS